jgi:hypothetical protein
MSLPWPSLLVVVSVLVFMAFLIWKLRPLPPLDVALGAPRRVGAGVAKDAIKETVRRERAHARDAQTPRARAEALLAAGRASALLDDGSTAALGLYLRSLRADPTYCEPLRALADLLHDERPELLETVLWRRLAQLSWSGETAPATRCAVEALVKLYRKDLRHRERAIALQKLLATL